MQLSPLRTGALSKLAPTTRRRTARWIGSARIIGPLSIPSLAGAATVQPMRKISCKGSLLTPRCKSSGPIHRRFRCPSQHPLRRLPQRRLGGRPLWLRRPDHRLRCIRRKHGRSHRLGYCRQRISAGHDYLIHTITERSKAGQAKRRRKKPRMLHNLKWRRNNMTGLHFSGFATRVAAVE